MYACAVDVYKRLVGDYIGIKFHYQGDKPHEHTYKTTVVKATASKDGSITRTCTGCDVKETTVIPYVKTIALSKTSYAYNGKIQKPSCLLYTSRCV